MSPTIRIIRKLTAQSRMFYVIHFTDGDIEVFDNQAKRDYEWSWYWRAGRTSVRLKFNSVAAVERFAADNETLATYRLDRKLTQCDVRTIERNRTAFLIPPMDALDGVFEPENKGNAPAPSTGESFGHPYCPPSAWPNLNEMLRKLGYWHGQTKQLDMLLVEDIFNHPDFTDGELDRCISIFKAEPNQDNMLLVRGAMHIYEWLSLA